MSPDGKRIAFNDAHIFWAEVQKPQPIKIVEKGTLPIWSPDGKRLLYHVGKMGEDIGWRGATWTIDLDTKKAEKLPIPETDEADDWSQQGDWLVTVSDRHPPFGSGYQLYVMHPDGTAEKRLTVGGGLNCYPRFSPDGKQIVYNHQAHSEDSLWIVNVDGSNRRQILASDNDRRGAERSMLVAGWKVAGSSQD